MEVIKNVWGAIKVAALFVWDKLKWLGNKIKTFYYRIFPKKEPKYYDAEQHSKRYLIIVAIVALCMELFIETFARVTTGPLQVFSWIFQHPLVFLYNTLIIFATLTLCFLFKRRRFALFFLAGVWFGLGFTNGVILLKRMTPFTLYDIANTMDGLTLVATYFTKAETALIFVGGAVLILTIIIMFVRSPKWVNHSYKRSIATVLVAALVAGGASWGAIATGVVSTFFGNLNYAYRDYGFPYCFIATSLNSGIKKPKGYSEEMIQNILENKTSSGLDTELETEEVSTKHPNIIVLQMESFTTADMYKHITVDKSPTPVFDSLKENYTSGYFEVPACGAGTSNTEFEVLTGISAKFFGPGEYPYKGKLREQTIENMAYVAKSHGYSTAALHNHRALFYNRNEVYNNMGFDSFTSVEYMNNLSFTPTNWCKDKTMLPDIKSIMEDSEGRDFLHIISVEGHGKYPTEQVFKNPYCTVTCDDEETKWKYEYYLNEMHEMDTFIGDLIDQLNESGEPTVMIIYGDHIPAIDVTEEIYNGPDLYSTEYVIWDNFGLKQKDQDIAAYEAGAILLDDAGLDGEGVIFDYQQTTSHDASDFTDNLQALSYDILYGDFYAFGGKNPYKPAGMQMGHKNIKIKGIIKIGDKYYVQGKNFTERSAISLDGKKLNTVYLSPTLLALNEQVDEEDIPKLQVSQVDKTKEKILTTVGANEEL